MKIADKYAACSYLTEAAWAELMTKTKVDGIRQLLGGMGIRKEFACIDLLRGGALIGVTVPDDQRSEVAAVLDVEAGKIVDGILRACQIHKVSKAEGSDFSFYEFVFTEEDLIRMQEAGWKRS